MAEDRDLTTIFYTLKLKRTRKPIEVFEKMAKSVKKRGATKKWICTYDEESFAVDFGDGLNETFIVRFDDKKVCNWFCKVTFPLSGELFDDEKKSEFKALLNMIYSVRTSFSEMKITDDYGISESFLDSKVNKIVLRELNDDEIERAKRVFNEGHTSIQDFITALMFDLREMSYSDNIFPYIICHLGHCILPFWDSNDTFSHFYEAFTESFLYETTEYKDQGRLYKVSDYFGELNGVYYSVSAFLSGINEITDLHHFDKGWDPKETQVLRLYKNKYLPLFEQETDEYNKCELSYRFFMSILEYLGFIYVGRTEKKVRYISDELADAVKELLENENYDLYQDILKKEIEREYV
ncbi:MAG: hypothetical protein K5979_02455 [Ruminococcus sp.]|nr:hypothetical protein [Ruminococcus sp.]